MQVLVTGFNSYSFSEANTNRPISGTNMYYLDPSQPANIGQVGILPVKVSVPSSLTYALSKAPAYYDIDFSTRPNAQGKPQLVLSSLEFVKDFPLVPASTK